MPKRFTPEQIEWMRNERQMGRAYSQIADNFPTKFPGEKRPSDSAVFNQASSVQVLVEETMEEDESLEETEVPTRPVSEEKKEKEDEILNEFIAGKTLTEILKNPEFHHDMVFRMQKVYEEKVINDKFTRYRNILVSAGVFDPKSKDAIAEGMIALVEIAGKAESDLEFLKGTVEDQKNKIFREYQEREEDLKRKLLEQKETLTEKIRILERTARENKKTYEFKEGQWANEFKHREEEHVENIEVWKRKVTEITYHSLLYQAFTNFSKSPEVEKEAYLRGIFNMIALLYGPFDETKKFRKKIENKLWKATRDRDWRKFTDTLSELAKKVGPYAEEWAKQESVIVSLARSDAQQELYNKLRFFCFTGSLQDLTEALDNYRTLPSKLKRMEHRFKELKPKVEELEFNEKLLGAWIPKLLELKEETLVHVTKTLQSTLVLSKKLVKWMNPKAYATFKEDISEATMKVSTNMNKLISAKETVDQTLSEYLESRKKNKKS